MTRNDRAIDMCNQALELVKTRGGPTGDMTRECTNAGMTIEKSQTVGTHRLTVGTKAGKVLAVEWGNSGTFRVLVYVPGLWETKLRHLAQRRQRD